MCKSRFTTEQITEFIKQVEAGMAAADMNLRRLPLRVDRRLSGLCDRQQAVVRDDGLPRGG